MDNNDEDFTELEAELRSLKPSGLATDFASRVERTLSGPTPVNFHRREFHSGEWFAWPIAACFVFTVAWLSGTGQSEERQLRLEAANSPSTYKPVEAENILYDVREEGLTTMPDGTPARRVRDRYLDVFTWENAAASSVRWSVPRDEVRLIPVEAY
jgi:hypothetical protein